MVNNIKSLEEWYMHIIENVINVRVAKDDTNHSPHKQTNVYLPHHVSVTKIKKNISKNISRIYQEIQWNALVMLRL